MKFERPIRIANCSGFFGDRLSAAKEMVEGGPIDFLTGDYLAELTMLILYKSALKHGGGYARTFLTQIENILGTIADKKIKVVSNAGGLNPAGLANEIRILSDKLGISLNVAHIEGDDIMPDFKEMQSNGVTFKNLDTGHELNEIVPVTANAYLGGFPIARALSEGADIVITGRVTDAALVIGPTIYAFDLERTDYDALAGALVAGHIIECGAQATGGNYSFFKEVPGLEHPGFPIAELSKDGSSIITMHENAKGLVSIGTVTSQLLYEISGHNYLNPDVIARFETIKLSQVAHNKVKVEGTKGLPPPKDLKVCINLIGGYRNSVTFVLTGLDIEDKAKLAENTFFQILGGKDQFDEVDVRLIKREGPDSATNEGASHELRILVKDRDEQKVGRRFSDAATQMALSSYPGFHLTTPPSSGNVFGVYWPALISSNLVHPEVILENGDRISIENSPGEDLQAEDSATFTAEESSDEQTRKVPLGTIVGARSGDKGGNANVGFFTKSDKAFNWLASYLSIDRFKELLLEAKDLQVDRYVFPNLNSINFVVHSILGEGVASSLRPDPQAKSLGEYLRGRCVEIPISLLKEN